MSSGSLREGRKKMGSGKQLPFYRNAEDTLEDVGITQRQLSYWRKQGLFTPELGPTSKKFTASDTGNLRFLKRLIEDLKIPIATVKKLIDSATEDHKDDLFYPTPPRYLNFIDISKARLVHPSDAMNKLIAEALGNSRPNAINSLVSPILLLALETSWRNSTNPDVYEAHLKSLHDKLDHLDLVFRLRENEEEGSYFFPKRPNDPHLSDELVSELSEERKEYFSRIVATRNAKFWRLRG